MKLLILDVDPSSPTFLGLAFDPKLAAADVISAFTLLVTVGIAWFATRSAMKQWLQQQRLSTGSEVAKEAMVSTFLVADYLTARVLITSPDNPSLVALETVKQSAEPMREVWERFSVASMTVEAHIPDALGVMEELRAYGSELHELQSRFEEATRLEQSIDFDPKRAYGTVPAAEIAALRKKVKDVLMPYAHPKK